MVALKPHTLTTKTLDVDHASAELAGYQPNTPDLPYSAILRATRVPNPKSGLNLLADEACPLFSLIGKIKLTHTAPSLPGLQQEMQQEVQRFQEQISQFQYNAEFIAVCRYVLLAMCDDIISHTSWGSNGRWAPYALQQENSSEPKFFAILERIIQEPATYIDLMELMYLALNAGYKGQFRGTEYHAYQLEQITQSLYQHIKAHRGLGTRTLSPAPIKRSVQPLKSERTHSPVFLFLITTCLIMAVFVSLGYLTDATSHEVHQTFAQITKTTTHLA